MDDASHFSEFVGLACILSRIFYSRASQRGAVASPVGMSFALRYALRFAVLEIA